MSIEKSFVPERQIEKTTRFELINEQIENSTNGNLNSKLTIKNKMNLNGDMSAGPSRPFSQVDRAIDDFERAGELDGEILSSALAKETTQMMLKHASVLMAAKEFQLASNILRNLLLQDSKCYVALEKMGKCFREEGLYDQALKCFRGLNKINNEEKLQESAQILIAETLYLAERDDVALAAYREVLKRSIQDRMQLFGIYKNIGNIHVRAGDYDAAEEFYNKAFTIQPQSDVLMVNYGTLEIQREDFAAAVLRFRQSVEINPENDKGWVGLAMVHRQMGDHDLAWANILRALDINKKNRTALRLVIEWAIVDHRFSTAIGRLQEYLGVEGEDAEMSFTLAKIFTHTGRLPEARLEMERVLALDPAIEGADALRKALDHEIGLASKKEFAC